MDPHLNKLTFLNFQNNTKEDLPDKARLFWQKTLAAGQREEKLPPHLQVKRRAWDYHVGAVKGWFKGLVHAVKQFVDPRSDFHNPDYREILKDIHNLPETALGHGMAFMDQDWEGRGEMNAEEGVKGGLWILKVYFGVKSVGRGLLKGAKNLLK